MGKIQSLYGTTPAEIFQSGVENIDQIEAVAASVLWKDGTVTSGWSKRRRRGAGADDPDPRRALSQAPGRGPAGAVLTVDTSSSSFRVPEAASGFEIIRFGR